MNRGAQPPSGEPALDPFEHSFEGGITLPLGNESQWPEVQVGKAVDREPTRGLCTMPPAGADRAGDHALVEYLTEHPAAVVWLSRPDPPSCTTLDNGIRACMPIYLVDSPLWLYRAFALIGALLAGGVAHGYIFVRGRALVDEAHGT